MSAVLSEGLATLAGDTLTGKIAPADAAVQLRLMAQLARLLEQEVAAFRILERDREFTRHLETQAMRNLVEMGRQRENDEFKPIRTGADIVALHPKTGGRVTLHPKTGGHDDG